MLYNLLFFRYITTTLLNSFLLRLLPSKKVLYNPHIDAYNAIPFPLESGGLATQAVDSMGMIRRGPRFSVCFLIFFAPESLQFSYNYKFNPPEFMNDCTKSFEIGNLRGTHDLRIEVLDSRFMRNPIGMV